MDSKHINTILDPEILERFSKKEFIPETNYAVGMGRVSIKKNKDKGNSDIIQVQRIKEYANTKDLKIEKFWDVAETATTHEKRINFHELLSFIEHSQKTKKPIKHVLFFNTSRGARNKKSKRELEELLELGVTIHFVSDNLVINSHSDLATTISWDLKAHQDVEEAKKLKEITWEGTVERLKMGLFPGKAPFGYENRRSSSIGGISIFVFTSEAEFMKEYFEKFATDLYSQSELLKLLAPKYPKIKIPSDSKMTQLLRKHFYYGKFEYMGKIWNGHPEYHPSLISFSLWKRVQDILNSRERTLHKSFSNPYIQMIKCGGRILDKNGFETETPCACSVTAEIVKKPLKSGGVTLHSYFRCGSRMSNLCSQRNLDFVKSTGRSKVSYTESELENLLLPIVQSISFSPDQVQWMIDNLLSQHQEAVCIEKSSRNALKSRYEMLFRYQDQAYEDKLKGLLSEESFREKNSRWQLEREEIKNQMEGMENNHDERIEEGITLFELLKDADIIWKNASSQVKAKILKILVSNLQLRDGKIDFKYKEPFSFLVNSSAENKIAFSEEGYIKEKKWSG